MNFRKLLRGLILLVGLAAVLWLLSGVWSNYREWRAIAASDPSAAELYSDNCLIDGALAAGALILTLISFFVLRQGK